MTSQGGAPSGGAVPPAGAPAVSRVTCHDTPAGRVMGGGGDAGACDAPPPPSVTHSVLTVSLLPTRDRCPSPPAPGDPRSSALQFRGQQPRARPCRPAAARGPFRESLVVRVGRLDELRASSSVRRILAVREKTGQLPASLAGFTGAAPGQTTTKLFLSDRQHAPRRRCFERQASGAPPTARLDARYAGQSAAAIKHSS